MPTRTASAKQIAANKANGLKSTGPRTAEGKARVSANAFKHGLRSERNPLDLANDMALPIERQEFVETLAAFMEDLAPVGSIETHFVERLAHITLRLHRAARMETAHLDISARKVFQTMGQHLPDEPSSRDNWLVTLAFLQNPAALNLISAYESRLSRDFARTLTQLRQSQKLRTADALCADQAMELADTLCAPNKITNQTQQFSDTRTRSLASDGQLANGQIDGNPLSTTESSSAQETVKQTQSTATSLEVDERTGPPVGDCQGRGPLCAIQEVGFAINSPSLFSSNSHNERT